MDAKMKELFQQLKSDDRELQMTALEEIMLELHEEVNWAYEVWDELREWMKEEDPDKRSAGAQLLAGLAISDPQDRILEDFSLLWEITYEQKLIAARQALQSVWRVGLGGEEQLSLVLHHMTERFALTDETNYELIRYDIITGLRLLYDFTEEEVVKETAEQLIEMEEEESYKKKYRKAWR